MSDASGVSHAALYASSAGSVGVQAGDQVVVAAANHTVISTGGADSGSGAALGAEGNAALFATATGGSLGVLAHDSVVLTASTGGAVVTAVTGGRR